MFRAQDGQGAGDTSKLLKEQLQLQKVPAEAGTRYHIRPIPRELSFDKGFFVCMRALQLLIQHNSGCIIVGVAGASGSGKTTFTQRLQKMMPDVAVLSMDMYNDGTKVMENNFDDPRIADYDLLLDNIRTLKAGKPCSMPVYDFKQSKRTGFQTVAVPKSRIIIVEGIYALSQRVAPLLDLKIAVTGGIHFDLVKRVMRDISRSGQDAGEVIQQISDTVFPMYKAFIEPDLKSAHIKINNNFNPFAGFKEPIQILKTDESVSVETVKTVLAELFPGDEIVEEAEIEMYDIFLLPPGQDTHDCTSWLRMRNKEGKYSLMFAEYIVNEPFIVSPRVSFEVPVRILGGLMALGYTIGSIMSRMSTRVSAGAFAVKWDRVEKLGCYMQIQGDNRDKAMDIARRVNVTNFIPRSYIDQVQLLRLTQDFQEINDEARRRFAFDDDHIIDDHVIGASPARPLMLRQPKDMMYHQRRSLAAPLGSHEPGGPTAASAPHHFAWQPALHGRWTSDGVEQRRSGSEGKAGGDVRTMPRSCNTGLLTQALSKDGHENGRIRRTASGEPGERRVRGSSGAMPIQGGATNGNRSAADSGLNGAAQTEQTNGVDSNHASCMPSFWDGKPPRPGSPIIVQPDFSALQVQLDKLVGELRLSTNLMWMCVGFAAGCALTAALANRR